MPLTNSTRSIRHALACLPVLRQMNGSGVGAVNQLGNHAEDVAVVHRQRIGVQSVLGFELAHFKAGRLVAQFVSQHAQRAERAK